MAGKMYTPSGLETGFRDMDMSRRIDSELSLTTYGDLGKSGIWRSKLVIN
jgi:hypothetical protein